LTEDSIQKSTENKLKIYLSGGMKNGNKIRIALFKGSRMGQS